jgi:hypothetical protein
VKFIEGERPSSKDVAYSIGPGNPLPDEYAYGHIENGPHPENPGAQGIVQRWPDHLIVSCSSENNSMNSPAT